MKNLTDYFSSPSEKTSRKVVPDLDEKVEQNPTNIVNNEEHVNAVTKKKRKSKKAKLRKLSDPAVKGITELMSSNLAIISPNTSAAETQSVHNDDIAGAELEDNIENLISEETGGSDKETGICVKIKASKFSKIRTPGNENSTESSTINRDTKISSNKSSITGASNSSGCNDSESVEVETIGNLSIIVDAEDSSSSESQFVNGGKAKVVNAFQFLMDSRFKTIGSNTPGKEVDNEILKNDESKEKLSARKHILSNWAEKKGASKRKREEAEKDEVINYKLKKRAKRLKKLLKAKTDNENDEEVKLMKKRIRKISTDTESSNDAVSSNNKKEDLNKKSENGNISKFEMSNRKSDAHEESNKYEKKKPGRISRKSKDSREIKKSSSKEDYKTDILESKCKKTDEDSNEDLRTELNNLEKNNTISNSHSNSSCESTSKESKNEALVSDDLKLVIKDTLEKNSESKTASNRKLKKVNSVEKENKNKELSEILDESAQDIEICSPKPKEGRQSLLNFFGVINKSNNTNNVNKNSLEIDSHEKGIKENGSPVEIDMKKMRVDIETVDLESDCTTNMTSTAESKNILDLNEEVISTAHTTTETEDTCDHAPEDTPSTRKRKKSKKKNKSKDGKTAKVRRIVDESSQEPDITPRRLRSWRMKIRMNLDENADGQMSPKDDSKDSDVVSLSSGSDFEDDIKTKKPKKAVKVAPVFAKAAPKPKIDPEVLEARKQFLMSGIPEALKKNMEKQQSLEEREYDVFPTISHVQQKCHSNSWTLPEANLKLTKFSPIKLDDFDFTHSLPCTKAKKLNIQIASDSNIELESLVNKIKSENPNYPVLKAFRQISERKETIKNSGGEKKSKAKSNSKKKRKSANKSVEIIEIEPEEIDIVAQAMWTEKYKPRNSDDIIGNTEAVKKLKKWLQAWWNFSEEIINSNKERKRRNSNSSDDFIVSDCSSRDTVKLPGNTVVLEGPCGSGKSTAVYSICNELGFNVIEVNASSKRMGKHLLQKLQEATQSHQVRKKESFANFLQQSDSQEADDKKMCVLLIEDIDIVFEQDDGFLPALMQLATTSKRPIILTTTDYESVFVQKSLGDLERISFMPLSAHSLAVWLQLVCLVEGKFVDLDEIGSLLEFNNGDARRTVLELQFWVQSGGDIVKNDMTIKIACRRISAEEILVSGEVKDEKRRTRNADEVVTHKNCLRSFQIFDGPYVFFVPYPLRLSLLWWNFSSILNIPDDSENRIKRLKGKKPEQLKDDKDYSHDDRLKLKELSRVYETVCLSDVLYRKMNIVDDSEPVVRNFKNDLKNSIELSSKIEDEVLDLDFVHEMNHYSVNGEIQRFKIVNKEEGSLNMAVPDKSERRWRAKQFVCEDLFKEALSFSTSLDRKAAALDYMPTMRCISRSEDQRAANNTKRGNRFRNYLRNLLTSCSDSTIKLACNILRE
ncbi:unnamed protein product [Acanthoscelides obtectus]|uniref:AAA+ ATPase domain-containing protein n=1 Tax=Acanthoscelides obtectus TaxID=200917 RepID=A0A9P0PM33_ACAOB|nr:unnamed protein product [Acanthoscelides obtectus]CAK1635662.1 ATPase family AAA domain-containing protein 5 [Acanthoscelides obtectus]